MSSRPDKDKEDLYYPGPPLRPVVYYPESDGLPMAETDVHYRNLTDLRYALERHFEAQGAVAYVGANMFLYYVEGDPTKSVAPDVFVSLGIAPGERPHYQVWKEGKVPDVVFELTSKSTRTDDLGLKLGLYGLLGVQEYFVFDPRREYLDPRLRGYRRHDDLLLPVAETPVVSRTLGLELVVVGESLRLRPGPEAPLLPTPLEESTARHAAEAEAKAERERAEAERERAEAERERAEAERERAEASEARASTLEAELARLRAELDRRGGS
jgi:Uma2 family endonuclease